jgi:hypothetical protein
MKNIVKLSFYVGILLTIYITAGDFINRILPDQDTFANTSLLFQYGGMIGFSLFIIFMIMMQSESMQKVRTVSPRASALVYYSYIMIGIIFILWTIISFTLQIAIIMALLFMLVTAVLDVIRDKIIQDHEGNQLHPKKTI